ncbi:MAG: hypothetical protein H0T79_23105, partial [Deltaproteobacteria bacterium]|nr:hypothetical protein [Deltaproteobacteria bacterium]
MHRALGRGLTIARCLPGFALGIALATGCQPADTEASSASIKPPVREVIKAPVEASPTIVKPLGQFTITFYYVIGEDEVVPKVVALPKAVASNDNQGERDTLAAAIAPPERTTLYTKEGCKPIAEVSREFASQLALQGTGKLRDGRVVNIWGSCSCEHSPCFKVTENQWGTSGSNQPLQPFRTVAVDRKVVKLGTLLHVPLLEGRLMPGRAPWGGFIHDGCVVADDTGGGIDGNQLDLFVGRRSGYQGLGRGGNSHAWAKHVEVFDGAGRCQRKNGRVSK